MVLGVPPPLESPQADRYWPGAIRPPAVPFDADRDPFGSAYTTPAAVPQTPVALAAPGSAGGTSRLTLLVVVTTVVVAVAAVLGHRRFARRRPA